MDVGEPTWLDDELAGCEFADQRLGKRLRRLLAQIGGEPYRVSRRPQTLRGWGYGETEVIGTVFT
jgi:hypothetical protein